MRPAGLQHAVDNDARTGEAFFKQAVSYNWAQRDSLALEYANAGQVPDFYFHFVPVTMPFTMPDGKNVKVTLYVAPDYLWWALLVIGPGYPSHLWRRKRLLTCTDVFCLHH